MQDFRRLKVWAKARTLTLLVYRASEHWPTSERYGLTAQLRRASVSITANIAEGCGRYTSRELAQFLQIALGSVSEVECLLILANDLGFLETTKHEELQVPTLELKRMLASLLVRVRQRASRVSTQRARSVAIAVTDQPIR